MVVSIYFGILVGLLLFNIFTHIQIAARSGWPRREVFLLSTIVAVLVYCMATYGEYRLTETASYFALIRVQLACEAVFMISFLEFILEVSKTPAGKVTRILELAFVGIIAVRMGLPNSGIYSTVSGMNFAELPWGETIALIDGQPTMLIAVMLAFVLAIFSIGVVALVKMYRKGARRGALLLMLAIALILAAIILDAVIAAGVIRWLYMTEGSYVAMTVMASLEVTDEVVQFSELKKTLEKTLEERNVLLMEIHHRVKNNLQVIASLLSLQAGSSGSAEVKVALEESTERVRTISLVHEQLYHSESLSDIDFADYSRILVDGIKGSFGHADGSIVFVSTVSALKLGIGLAVPLGLILNELVTNSIKYGRADRDSVRIELAASRSGDRVAFAFTDDGPGFPPGLDPGRDGNLGLTLIRILAEQIHAVGGFNLQAVDVSYRIETRAD